VAAFAVSNITSNNLIINGSVDPTIPAGRAMTGLQCQYSYCSWPDTRPGANHECTPWRTGQTWPPTLP
jgi:hypothetical protein